MAKKTKEKSEDPVKKRKKRKPAEDLRAAASFRISRMSARVALLNRRLFGGANEQLTSAFKALESVRLHVESLPSGWRPSLKGKHALIPGVAIAIRPDIAPERLAAYTHMGGVARFAGGVIVHADDKYMLQVRLTDGVLLFLPKRDCVAAAAATATTVVAEPK